MCVRRIWARACGKPSVSSELAIGRLQELCLTSFLLVKAPRCCARNHCFRALGRHRRRQLPTNPRLAMQLRPGLLNKFHGTNTGHNWTKVYISVRWCCESFVWVLAATVLWAFDAQAQPVHVEQSVQLVQPVQPGQPAPASHLQDQQPAAREVRRTLEH